MKKYYSDLTNKLYDTEEEFEVAEKKYQEEKEKKELARKEKEAAMQKKNEERKIRAQEVEDAYKAILEARKVYVKLLNDFCKDYGSYHYSYKLNDDEEGFPFNFSSMFDFFNF